MVYAQLCDKRPVRVSTETELRLRGHSPLPELASLKMLR